jgi:uncharacterized membrane protein YgcG|eukprot:COSAG02_NODE_21_length_53083_cov_95.733618_17_plen_573_part_00
MPSGTKAADAEQLGGQVIVGQLGRYRIVEGGGWLGGGASANVFLAVNEYTMDRVAVKAIDRFVIEQNSRKRELLVRELNIATKLKHPNIINLMEVVFDENYVHLIMELAAGGELYGSVKDGAFEEPRAKVVFHQIVSALAYCHGNGVCHRDLKLENLVLVEEAAGMRTHEFVKVTDFGLSKDSAMHSQPNTKVGTISYMAPEVTMANSSHVSYDGQAADVWSLGVILYILVCCAYPFGYDGPADMGGEPTSKVCARIRKGKYTIPSALSEECRSLLTRMLDANPATRISAKDALAHPWLANVKGAAFKLSSAASAAAAAGFDAVAWPVPKGAAGGTLWFAPSKSGGGGEGSGSGSSGTAAAGGGHGGSSMSSCGSVSWESDFDEDINDCIFSVDHTQAAYRDGSPGDSSITATEPEPIDEYSDGDDVEEGEPPATQSIPADALFSDPEPVEEGRPGRRRRNSLQHDERGLEALRSALDAASMASVGPEAGCSGGVPADAVKVPSPVESLEMLPVAASAAEPPRVGCNSSSPVSPAADPTSGVPAGSMVRGSHQKRAVTEVSHFPEADLVTDI